MSISSLLPASAAAMERPSSIVQWERAEVYKCAFSILMHFTTAAEAQDYADEGGHSLLLFFCLLVYLFNFTLFICMYFSGARNT